MFNRNRRTYSLTSYTGVGVGPPNSHPANPAAIAAAGAVGLTRSTSTSSQLSSAAAAAAIRRHSLTSTSSTAADRIAASHQPSRTSNGAPGLPRSNSRQNVNRTNSLTSHTTRSTNPDRSMSLTTTTVRTLGSFQLITTKTTPINGTASSKRHSYNPRAPRQQRSGSGPNLASHNGPPSARSRPGYASSILSYESDLNPVSEEPFDASFDATHALTTSGNISAPVTGNGPAKTVAPKVTEEIREEEEGQHVHQTGQLNPPSIPAAIGSTGASSPTSLSPTHSPSAQHHHASFAPVVSVAPSSSLKPIKHQPPPRNVSPMKPALKDSRPSSIASDSFSVDEIPYVKPKRSAARVSFTEKESQFLLPPQNNFSNHPQPRGRTSNPNVVKPVAVRAYAGAPVNSATAAAVATFKKQGSNGGPYSTHKRHNKDDSDSGDSVYSDAFEDIGDNYPNIMDIVDEKQKDSATTAAAFASKRHLSKRLPAAPPTSKSTVHGPGPNGKESRTSLRASNNGTAAAAAAINGGNARTAHSYRSLAYDDGADRIHDYEDTRDLQDEEDDVISMNSDSSWRRDRKSTNGFVIHSLRDSVPVETSRPVEISHPVDKSRRNSESRTFGASAPSTNGSGRTYSLRNNHPPPPISAAAAVTADISTSSTVQRTFSNSSFEKNRRRPSVQNQGFKLLSLRQEREEPAVVQPPANITAKAGPFRSRFADSDSDDGNLGIDIPPLPSVAATSNGPTLRSSSNQLTSSTSTSGLKSVFRSRKSSRQESVGFSSRRAPAEAVIPAPPDHASGKKKRFPGLRRVFGLD